MRCEQSRPASLHGNKPWVSFRALLPMAAIAVSALAALLPSSFSGHRDQHKCFLRLLSFARWCLARPAPLLAPSEELPGNVPRCRLTFRYFHLATCANLRIFHIRTSMVPSALPPLAGWSCSESSPTWILIPWCWGLRPRKTPRTLRRDLPSRTQGSRKSHCLPVPSAPPALQQSAVPGLFCQAGIPLPGPLPPPLFLFVFPSDTQICVPLSLPLTAPDLGVQAVAASSAPNCP